MNKKAPVQGALRLSENLNKSTSVSAKRSNAISPFYAYVPFCLPLPDAAIPHPSPASVLPPEKEYIRMPAEKECAFKTYTITAKDVCSFEADGDHAFIVCPVISIPENESLAEQINTELLAWLTDEISIDDLSFPEGVTLIDCTYSIAYADETKFSIMCYIDSFVFNGIAGMDARKGITVDVKSGKICTLSDVCNVKELPETAQSIGFEASHLYTTEGILRFFADQSSASYTNFSITENGFLLVLPTEIYARSTANAIIELRF